MDAARSMTTFIRKATLPTIAGNPPADAAQPSGMKGMMVTVQTNVMTDPAAPSAPSKEQQRAESPLRNAQKPARSTDTEHGVQPGDERAVADVWNQDLRLVVEPFLSPSIQQRHEDLPKAIRPPTHRR
jgi:hypothetical protein